MALERGTHSRPTSLYDPETDYYAVLQVHPAAHAEVIKRAYRALLGVLGAHPDRGGDHEGAVLLNTAYAVLSHPDTRRAYDTARRRALLRLQLGAAPYRGHAHGHTHTGNVLVVRCHQCGARNRLPASADLGCAVCGKCRNLLGQGW